MKQTTLLQIVERLERLLGRLPEKIRKPVLSELTPLKELFLRQRAPRFLFVGVGKLPMREIIRKLFAPDMDDQFNVTLMPVHRWSDWSIPGRGTIAILDGRDASNSAKAQIELELEHQPSDIVFFLDDAGADLETSAAAKFVQAATAKIVVVSVEPEKKSARPTKALRKSAAAGGRLLETIRLAETKPETEHLMSILTEQLPNEAKIEMIRISGDRAAQHHVARMLVKSTSAVCTAIGAQPIPLADLPILTSLQLMMISGIMYVSGRERSLRAATEFIGAIGANVGAALLLREGARTILRFFPGWGNVVSGLVAGSGTYAIGRAATVFFVDGVSLKDARRTYLRSRKRRKALPSGAR